MKVGASGTGTGTGTGAVAVATLLLPLPLPLPPLRALQAHPLTRRRAGLALKWFKKAAKQGLAAAQDNVGSMLQHGLGTKQVSCALCCASRVVCGVW